MLCSVPVDEVVLAMQKRQIPPNLHLNKLNPNIEPLLEDFPVVMPSELTQWHAPTPQPTASEHD